MNLRILMRCYSYLLMSERSVWHMHYPKKVSYDICIRNIYISIYIYIYIYIYTYIYIYIYIYVYIIYIYIYTYIKLNRYWCVLRYTYTIHYAYAYNYIQYVLSEKEDRQHLLKAKVKLAKYPASATYCFYCPLTTLRADYYALSPLWAEGNHQHLLRA